MLTYDHVDEHVAALKKDGYAILRGLLDKELVPALREEALEVIRETQPPHPQLQQSSQYLQDSHIDRLVNSDSLLALAGFLCEGPCLRFLPFTAVKPPGGSLFQYHQDNQYCAFDGTAINFWMALEDIDETNGCLWLVPGSHKMGALDWVPTGDANKSRTIAWEPEDARPVPLRAGDCVVFDRLTIHSSGGNRTASPRVAYSVSYHREEVSFLDKDQQWKPLKTHSRWRTMAIDHFTKYSETSPGGHR
jgi:2-oxoglutarate-dependent dioxygenase